MAHKRVLIDWAPIRWLPFIERRYVGLFLDSYPALPVDVSAFWHEYRLALSQDPKVQS